MNEKGLMKSSSGTKFVFCFALQDIAVIPMLAIFPLLATQVVQSGEDHHTLVRFHYLAGTNPCCVGAVALIIVGGRFLIHPVFRISSQKKPEYLKFTAASLLLGNFNCCSDDTSWFSPCSGTFLAELF